MTLVDLIAKYLPEDIKLKVFAGQQPRIGANSLLMPAPQSDPLPSAVVVRPPAPVEAQLAGSPAAVLAVSSPVQLPADLGSPQAPDSEFEERAAILEFDAGFNRREAEEMAKRRDSR